MGGCLAHSSVVVLVYSIWMSSLAVPVDTSADLVPSSRRLLVFDTGASDNNETLITCTYINTYQGPEI